MTTTDIRIIDSISADSIQVGDQILIDGEPVEVHQLLDADDIDEVRLMVWSWDEGDTRPVSLYADDYFDLWVL